MCGSDWVNCSECIILKEEGDCVESRRSDGCYFGVTEADVAEEEDSK